MEPFECRTSVRCDSDAVLKCMPDMELCGQMPRFCSAASPVKRHSRVRSDALSHCVAAPQIHLRIDVSSLSRAAEPLNGGAWIHSDALASHMQATKGALRS